MVRSAEVGGQTKARYVNRLSNQCFIQSRIRSLSSIVKNLNILAKSIYRINYAGSVLQLMKVVHMKAAS